MRRRVCSGIIRGVAQPLWVTSLAHQPANQSILVHHRRFASKRNVTLAAAPQDTHLADLDDFEAALLGSETTGGNPTSDVTLEEADAAGGCPPPPEPFCSDAAIQGILDVLPVDCSRVPLTSLTVTVNIEAVADHCGSLLALLQQYPHLVSVERTEQLLQGGAARWVVGRKTGLVGASPLPPLAVQSSHDVNAGFAGNNLKKVGPTERRLGGGGKQRRLVTTAADATSASAALFDDTSVMERICSAVGDAPMDLFTLRTMLMQGTDNVGPLSAALAKVEQIMSLRAALQRHPVAKRDIVWCDAKHVAARRAFSDDVLCVLDAQATRTSAPTQALLVVPDDEYASDPWMVDLELDVEPEPPQLDEMVDEALPVATVVAPHAPTLPPGLLEGIPRIPPQSAARRSAVRRMAPPPPGVLHKPSLASTNAPLAQRPSEILLELFLEVVPTQPVPVAALRTSDVLSRVVGNVPLVKILRRFPMVFAVDNVVGTVCVKPSTSPRSATADALYVGSTAGASQLPPIQSAVKTDQHTECALRLLIASVAARNVVPPPPNNHRRPKALAAALGSPQPPIPQPSLLEGPLSLRLLSGDGRCVWQLPTECFTSTVTMRRGGEAAMASFVEQHWAALLQQAVLIVHPCGDDGCATAWRDATQPVDRMLLRLRPIGCSPSAIGALDRTTTPLPPSVHATMLARLKPLWTPIDKWIERAPADVLEAFRTAASVLVLPDGIKPLRSASDAGAPESKCGVVADAVLLVFLMHGCDVWVSACGTKVRRYTGHPELDDAEHYVVALLHASLPLPAAQGSPDDMVDLVAHTMGQPFSKVLWGGALTPSSCAVRAVAATLALHKARFVVVERPAAVDGEANGGCGWHIGRYSPFRAANQPAVVTANVAPPARWNAGTAASGSWAAVLQKPAT